MNDKMNKIVLRTGWVLFLCITLTCVAITFWIADGAQAQGKKKDVYNITFVQTLTQMEWPAEMSEGARCAEKELNGKVKLRIIGPPVFDVQKQAQVMVSEAEAGADAEIINNVAAAAMVEPARQVLAKGVPMTWTCTAPPETLPDAFFCATSAWGVGRTMGEITIKALEEQYGKPASQLKGEIVNAMCMPGLGVLQQRLDAWTLLFKKRMPNVNLLPAFDSKADRAQNYTAWDQAIRKHPHALAYADPCEDSNKNITKITQDDKIKVPIIFMDNPEEARNDLKEGLITAIISSDRFVEGYLAVWYTYRSLAGGGHWPKGWVKLPSTVITKANIDPYIAAWNGGQKGLREFFRKDIDALRDIKLVNLPPAADYNRPEEKQ